MDGRKQHIVPRDSIHSRPMPVIRRPIFAPWVQTGSYLAGSFRASTEGSGKHLGMECYIFPPRHYGIVAAHPLVVPAMQKPGEKGTSIVTPRAAIQHIARMVRDDIRSGELSSGAHSVGDMLAAQPEALLLIVDLTGDEGRKKRPDATMHHAYSFMLGQTLAGC